MNKYFIYIVLVVVVLLGFYFYYVGTQKGQEMPVVGVAPMMPEMPNNETMPVQPSPITAPIIGAPASVPVGKNYTVEIINNEFRPAVVKIKKGDSVTWINKMAAVSSWPASAVHPIHKVYPGSGIEKCGTAQAVGIFDACRGLKTGESWIFTFNEVGSWKYHDHMNAGTVKPGTVEVSE